MLLEECQKLCFLDCHKNLRPNKINCMFLRHRPCHFQPPASKILLHFQYSHFKIVYTSRIVSLGRPSFATILFVDWLVRILEVENFSGNYSFFSILFQKNKNKKLPPASFSKKSARETLIFFGLIDNHFDTTNR